jgi:hypothetical protein
MFYEYWNKAEEQDKKENFSIKSMEQTWDKLEKIGCSCELYWRTIIKVKIKYALLF